MNEGIWVYVFLIYCGLWFAVILIGIGVIIGGSFSQKQCDNDNSMRIYIPSRCRNRRGNNRRNK